MNLYKPFGFACLCATVLAAPSALATPTHNTGDLTWLLSQLKQHPNLQADFQQLQSATASVRAAGQSLYNPNLESSIEKEGDANNFSIGLSQTFDINDQQQAQHSAAQLTLVAQQQRLQLTYLQLVEQTLIALINWRSSKAAFQLAQQQEQQLERLVTVVKRRRAAGEVGLLDEQLALYSLSEILNQTAQQASAYADAKLAVQALLPTWHEDGQLTPEQLLSGIKLTTDTENVVQHPQLLLVKSQWQQQRQQVKVIKAERAVKPTIGLVAGKNGDDNLVSVSFSMPLNIVNNFSDEYQAAEFTVMSKEAEYQALKRTMTFQAQASKEVMQAYAQRVKRWQSINQANADSSLALIEQQWQSGDISTAEYLTMRQQRISGLLAGIEIVQQSQLASVNWLTQSGQLSHYISTFTDPLTDGAAL
ncbi:MULTISPECIES: TolC family protein [unclassified Pseudoalteromonas]|uniref:TolC family protein n=1 Tax=unclassified Pseudoalteromonas TaxID=194690 RepID=UPI0016017D27|nr:MULTISPECIES: TolC family protein [unclassified Pseudoalteromonas]MBB1333453.1 TolC family protein [Pseudoalteromonas sp. SR41-6]MBB1458857.1 TolC family protein [Pseudoalteromonas sp. SG41-8]